MAPRDFRELSLTRATRALELACRAVEAREVLLFFAAVAQFQAEHPMLDVSWSELVAFLPSVRQLIEHAGTDSMREISRSVSESRFEEELRIYWTRVETERIPSLLPRIVLQPFAYANRQNSGAPMIQPPEDGSQFCPHCFHAPQLGLLRTEGHGQVLSLSCSLCLHEWPAPRNRCTYCGSDAKDALEFYSAESFPGRSLQTCRQCNTYIHLIEVPEGSAVLAPDADEIAGITLDVWAVGRGLEKHQPNLAGI